MNKINVLFACIFFLSACGQNSDDPKVAAKSDLKSEIALMDDSLRIYFDEVMSGKTTAVPAPAIEKSIDMHMRFYYLFPQDEFAAECLDKSHQLYMQQQSYLKSVQVCDTLVAKYPKYKDMHVVLLSAGTTYDYMLNDKKNAKKYYELILKSPAIDKATRKDIAFRLKNIDKSLEEIVKMQR